MTRTQIQLPDDVYLELKQLSEEKEWSLAEAVRRGVELLLRSYPRERSASWELPPAVPLGTFAAPPSDWRALANERGS